MPTTHAGSIYDVEGPLDSVWGEGGGRIKRVMHGKVGQIYGSNIW